MTFTLTLRDLRSGTRAAAGESAAMTTGIDRPARSTIQSTTDEVFVVTSTATSSTCVPVSDRHAAAIDVLPSYQRSRPSAVGLASCAGRLVATCARHASAV